MAGAHEEGERLSARAIAIASTIDMYGPKASVYEAAATALAINEAKGDIPATAWARELLDSLSA